jgi:hypothetical protein
MLGYVGSKTDLQTEVNSCFPTAHFNTVSAIRYPWAVPVLNYNLNHNPCRTIWNINFNRVGMSQGLQIARTPFTLPNPELSPHLISQQADVDLWMGHYISSKVLWTLEGGLQFLSIYFLSWSLLYCHLFILRVQAGLQTVPLRALRTEVKLSHNGGKYYS